MGVKYAILPVLQGTDSITIHKDTGRMLGLEHLEEINLRFGNQTLKVQLIMSAEIDPEVIRLSRNVIKTLSIPLSPLYELIYKESELIIGPYMGILAAPTEASLQQRLENLTSYLQDYETIGGAVLVFSLEGVRTKKPYIYGYVFNPQQNIWERGMFPYPAAVFSTIEVSMTRKWEQYKAVMKHFHSLLGNRIFNYPNFDKWEMVQWLVRYPGIREHLPETILYTHPDEIVQMLKKYGRVYIKPILGRLGLGVMEATLDRKAVIIRFRKNNTNQKIIFHSFSDLHQFCRRNLQRGNMIVQRAIDILTVRGRILDFRLVLVKELEGEWRNMGIFARYGAKRSVVSNISAGGNAEWGDQTLETLGHSKDEWLYWKNRLSSLAYAASKAMEEHVIQCGNFGIDLAIDKQERIWILEINNQNPDHNIALLAGKKEIFLKARRANMLFLKRLAGFFEEPTKSGKGLHHVAQVAGEELDIAGKEPKMIEEEVSNAIIVSTSEMEEPKNTEEEVSNKVIVSNLSRIIEEQSGRDK